METTPQVSAPQSPPTAHQAAPGSAGGSSQISHEITHNPSFAMLRFQLHPGQEVTTEAGSMVARDTHTDMRTHMNAGAGTGLMAKVRAFVIALIRRILGGETFFVNTFTTSSNSPANLWLAPSAAGSIQHRVLRGEAILVSTGAYLAHTGNIQTRIRFAGLRGLFAKEGLFFLELSGEGEVWFNSYGGIHAVPVDGTYIVDNGHIVGHEGDLSFSITTVGGGMMGLFASGEGLVCKYKGKGIVYIQSRNASALVEWIGGRLH